MTQSHIQEAGNHLPVTTPYFCRQLSPLPAGTTPSAITNAKTVKDREECYQSGPLKHVTFLR